MYTVIWREKDKDKWDRFETRAEVITLLKSLKDNPDVCEGDVWIFRPYADNFATDYDTFVGGEKMSKFKVGHQIVGNEKASDDFKACEALVEEIYKQMNSDTEPWDKKGRRLLQSYMEKDVDGILEALTGWSMKSLLALAKVIPDNEGVVIE